MYFDSNAWLSSAINADLLCALFKNTYWDVMASASSSILIYTDDLTDAAFSVPVA